MARIAHLADLHVGFSHLNAKAADGRNQRLVDFEQAALLAADEVVRLEPDLAVVAGDFFHETNLYPAALSGAVQFCERLAAAGIPLIVIGGNHDEAESQGRYNSLRFLADHHNVQLHLDQGHLDIADVRLHLVSYRVLSRAQRGRGDLEAFEFSSTGPNVLVAHGYAPGIGVPEIPEGTETLIPPEWLVDPRFSLCLLGHIHHHGEIADHVFYAGSTERRNFGEHAERPGFYIHEVSGDGQTSSQSIYIDEIAAERGISLPRPMLNYELDTAELTVEEASEQVEKWIDEAPEGSMLRVVLYNVSAELDRSQARMDWERRHLKRGGFYFEASVQTRRVSELLDVKFEEPPADVAKGLLDFIARQRHESEEDRRFVTELASEVISEARERVMTAEGD